jgi:TM2 domain-containing membrane protein YozV
MTELPTPDEGAPAKVPTPMPFAPPPPPHPLDSDWYVHIEGQTYGPYSGHQLADFAREGRIDGATQVMLVGSQKWTRAAEEPRLAAIFRAASRSPAPPPVSAAPGSTVVQVTNTVAAPSVIILDDGSPFGPKSPGLALILSLLLCGAGQMYCGRVGRGFLMLLGCIVLWFVLLGWVIWIWSMVDAYNTAKKMNLKYLQRMQALQAR